MATPKRAVDFELVELSPTSLEVTDGRAPQPHTTTASTGDVPRVDNGPVQRAPDAILVVLRAAVDVLQPFVQKEKWQAVTFQNSFSDYSTAVFQPTSYKKDPLGRVYLRARISRCSGPLHRSFLLAAGYRPAKNSQFAVMANDKFARLEVTSGGVVQVVAADSATWYTYFSLDGISFDTES